MNFIIIQDAVFLVLLIGLSIPLGIYIYKVMTGQKVLAICSGFSGNIFCNIWIPKTAIIPTTLNAITEKAYFLGLISSSSRTPITLYIPLSKGYNIRDRLFMSLFHYL